MPKISDRYNRFLNDYNFFSNSIKFRIYSSKALEKWKNIQAFQLNQLANGNMFFPKDRKEILLLKYDLWSRWLYEVENLCIEASNGGDDFIQAPEVDQILHLAEKTVAKIKDIMLTDHPDNFDSKFAQIWLRTHEFIEQYLLNELAGFVGESFNIAFSKIVDMISEIMQYTLVEIFEIDALTCKNTGFTCDDCKDRFECSIKKKSEKSISVPFVIVTELTEKIREKYGVCVIAEKLKIYSEYYDVSTIYLKNYTDDNITLGTIDVIENAGYKIDFKLSISK